MLSYSLGLFLFHPLSFLWLLQALVDIHRSYKCSQSALRPILGDLFSLWVSDQNTQLPQLCHIAQFMRKWTCSHYSLPQHKIKWKPFPPQILHLEHGSPSWPLCQMIESPPLALSSSSWWISHPSFILKSPNLSHFSHSLLLTPSLSGLNSVHRLHPLLGHCNCIPLSHLPLINYFMYKPISNQSQWYF